MRYATSAILVATLGLAVGAPASAGCGKAHGGPPTATGETTRQGTAGPAGQDRQPPAAPTGEAPREGSRGQNARQG